MDLDEIIILHILIGVGMIPSIVFLLRFLSLKIAVILGVVIYVSIVYLLGRRKLKEPQEEA